MSTFDKALNHLRQGLPVRRRNWAKDRYLMHVLRKVETISDVCLSTPIKPVWVWNPSTADIIAHDWELIEVNERTYRQQLSGLDKA